MTTKPFFTVGTTASARPSLLETIHRAAQSMAPVYAVFRERAEAMRPMYDEMQARPANPRFPGA